MVRLPELNTRCSFLILIHAVLETISPAGARRVYENKVCRSCWGEPWQVSELRTAAGEARVWFYPCGARAYYLTFQAGKLTSVYSE